MTAPYKKRAKSGWNHDKEQSNKDERAFEKREIDQLTNGVEDNKILPVDKKPKKKPLKAKDVANKINALERRLEFFKKPGFCSSWMTGVISRYEEELKELNELYTKLKDKR